MPNYGYTAKDLGSSDSYPPGWPEGWDFPPGVILPPGIPIKPPVLPPNFPPPRGAIFFGKINSPAGGTFHPTFTSVETLWMESMPFINGGLPMQGNSFSKVVAAGEYWPYVYCNNPELVTALNITSDEMESIFTDRFKGLLTLTASGNTAMSSLNVSGNTALNSLNVSGCTDLGSITFGTITTPTIVNIGTTALTALPDMSAFASTLDQLSIDGLTMSTIDLSTFTGLTVLTANDTSFTALDLTSNTSLEYVDCIAGSLTSIDISLSTNLYWVELTANSLPESEVDGVLSDLVSHGLSGGVLAISGGGNAAPSVAGYANKTTLESRGWTVLTTVPIPMTDPEMLVTVTGATGTITWCGETWELPGDSGVQKSVCPTTYVKGKGVTPNTIAQHRWLFSPDGLVLNRFYNRFGGSSFTAVNGATVNDGTISAADIWSFFGFTFSPTPGIVYSRQDMGVLTSGDPWPTYSAYLITNSFFGSYTTGGITYTWEKGAGW